MLARRRRRRANIKSTLGHYVTILSLVLARETYILYKMYIQIALY